MEASTNVLYVLMKIPHNEIICCDRIVVSDYSEYNFKR